MSLPSNYNTIRRTYQTWDTDPRDYRNESFIGVSGLYDLAVWDIVPEPGPDDFNLANTLVKSLDGSYTFYFDAISNVELATSLVVIDLSPFIPEKLASFQSTVIWQPGDGGPINQNFILQFQNGNSTLNEDKIIRVFNRRPGQVTIPLDIIIDGSMKLYPQSFIDKFITS